MRASEFIIEDQADNPDSWQSQAADQRRDVETARMSAQDAEAGGVAEAKRKKKSSRSTRGYFFPGYAYYGGGDSGEGGGDGGGESVNRGMAEGSLNEASSDEAWELVGQPVPEIQQFVKQMGYGYDDQSVAKITAVIDRVISTQLPVASIPKLKNLANKGTDVQTLKAVQQISGRPDAEQQYTKLMKARDAAEGRDRDVSGYLQYVKSGNYDPPVLLKLPTGIYVIGGRTRLYAALALGVPANVKIISANNFKQGVAEGDLNEKSTSQAQFRTMAAAAHNPKFAKKVGISPDVAREFHGADKKSNYKSLPKKAAEDASWGMAPEGRGYKK
jgi:hypothetical protein